MTCPETIAIGAYVLGALDAEERVVTEQHLQTCEPCRETLLQFAHLPGLLHAVPLEDIVNPPAVQESAESWIGVENSRLPTAEIHDSTTVVVSRGRLLRRRRHVVAAAVVVVVVGVVGVIGPRIRSEPAERAITWSSTDGVGGIDTTAELTGRGWGTDIQLRMTDLRPGAHCKLIVRGRDGTTETVGWWATTSTYQADVPASTSIPLAQIAGMDVVTAGGTVLTTLTPPSR
jgi:putative zinc finger protein